MVAQNVLVQNLSVQNRVSSSSPRGLDIGKLQRLYKVKPTLHIMHFNNKSVSAISWSTASSHKCTVFGCYPTAGRNDCCGIEEKKI